MTEENSSTTPGIPAERLDALGLEGAPSVEDRIYEQVVRLRRDGAVAALATVIGTRGSTPAREPMKLLVQSSGETLGTVGGGCLEEEVKRLAREVMDQGAPARFSMDLTGATDPDAALICGGTVEVFVEPVTAPPLVIFGGGHVSRAVAAIAARVGFRLVITDDRADYASLDRFPMAAETRVEFPETAAREIPVNASTYVLVMTRTHADDRRILEQLFRRGAQPRYLGMIGSATKVRKTYEMLAEAGVTKDWLRQIRAPVGLRIGARTSDEIAVAVVAEMIAVRRGKTEGRWSVS